MSNVAVEDNSELSWTNYAKSIVFFAIHVACLGVFFVQFSWTAIAVCAFLYFIRMFAITGAYHRYFSHRTYKTSRIFQFLLGFLGTMSAQKGPIWWAANHRHHHQHSDTEEDIHSVKTHGLWHAHVGWILSSDYLKVKSELIKDFLAFPEIKWLDNYHLVGPILLGAMVVGLGVYLEQFHPGLGVTPWSLFIWGFCVSTTLLYHGTFFINSLAHLIGSRRFNTTDESKNSLILALITLGEGWHNNHHRYPGSEKQGFYWWEIDITHYMLKMLSWVGLVWDIREPPKRIYDEAEALKKAA